MKIFYEVTEKRILEGTQVIATKEFALILTKKGITSHNDTFPLHTVQDISYKPYSDGSGFLYLHTNRGVYPFLTRYSVHEFLDAYVALKRYTSK